MQGQHMHYDSIGDLARRIRSREVSPVDVVETCLRRIEALNPRLNAFITVMRDEARERAKAAEADIAAGLWRGPLHGVPVAVKDFYDTAGVRTTAGAEPLKERIASADAECVKRLRQAGAVIVGKTNMDAFGMATTGMTSCFGAVLNPWDIKYVPGGSSAGSAAAVAAGLCYATVDTDAVGSVRLPAACCAVVGFKGSYGSISVKGILGDEPVDDFIRWMGHAGLTTRSAADAALMVAALADGIDPAFLEKAVRCDTAIRIGMGNNLSPALEVRQALDRAVTVLRSIGYHVGEAAVPFGDASQGSMDKVQVDRAAIAGQAFVDVDVIVLPTLASTVPTVEEAAKDPEQAVSAETTAFANYYGLPVASVPCGFDRNGMPIGLQIVGKPGDDAVVLNISQQYERAAGLGSRHPID